MAARRNPYALATAVRLGWGMLAVALLLPDAGCRDRHATPAPGADGGVGVVASAPLRRLRRLSSREYDNVARDLLGDGSHPAAAFLADVYQNGYDNGAAGLVVQSDQVAAYQAAAEALAGRALADNRRAVLGDCDPAVAGDAACLDRVLATFAPRAYRRPLTATETVRLRDVFQFDAQQGAGFDRALRTVVEVILQSPQFLYREELGPPEAPGAGPGTKLALTDHEMAAQLSFLLTGSLPDDELWAAVGERRFATAAQRHAQAVRLLATGAARDSVRSFLHQWLATRRLGSVAKSAALYPAWSPALARSMSSELDRFFDDVVWNGSGSLRELFTSTRSFADQALGQLYGADVIGPELQPVALDPRLRTGILTRAGFLAVHADSDSSGPIARGVFVLSSIACLPPSPPPPGIPPAPMASDPGQQGRTTRQRFDQHVSSQFCATCHTQIDGIGFGFEAFDGVGAYRTTDNGSPVDSGGNIIGLGDDIDGPFDGVAELASRLAGSRVLSDCYARQLYRFAMGEAERPKQDITWLTSAASSDARLADLLLTVVDSAAFTHRVFE